MKWRIPQHGMFFTKTLSQLLKPVAKDKDTARREHILNIVLFSSIVLTVIALLATVRSDYWLREHRTGDSSAMLFGILALFLFFFWLSKKGYSRVVSYLLLGIYFFLVSKAIQMWGADMPVGLLMYALLIVVSGILISSKFSIFITFLICIFLMLTSYLDDRGILTFQQDWKSQPILYIDVVVLCIIFLIIAAISWLFNRESEKALDRARISETALKRERDSLAAKVEKKTRELRVQQAEKMAQLYRFAEFGKLASGFLHDISNSVNLVSANLTQIEKTPHGIATISDKIARARAGTKRLESFIQATRKQVNNQEFFEYFSVNNEISQVIDIVSYKAKNAHVTVLFPHTVEIKTFGNSIKFHQLVSNLISNAIDAYDRSHKKNKPITIGLKMKNNIIELAITDEGSGIASKNLQNIFEPFFTTKGFKKGTGIGLAISYGIVHDDFKGTIDVKSKLGSGTTFIIKFPHRTHL